MMAKQIEKKLIPLSKEARELLGRYKTLEGTEIVIQSKTVRNMEGLEWATVRELGRNRLFIDTTVMEVQKKIGAKLIWKA